MLKGAPGETSHELGSLAAWTKLLLMTATMMNAGTDACGPPRPPVVLYSGAL